VACRAGGGPGWDGWAVAVRSGPVARYSAGKPSTARAMSTPVIAAVAVSAPVRIRYAGMTQVTHASPMHAQPVKRRIGRCSC